MFERFGRKPYGEILKRVQTSPNYIKGAFRNKEITPPELIPKNPAGIFLES